MNTSAPRSIRSNASRFAPSIPLLVVLAVVVGLGLLSRLLSRPVL